VILLEDVDPISVLLQLNNQGEGVVVGQSLAQSG
jgi:hypothetical protein